MAAERQEMYLKTCMPKELFLNILFIYNMIWKKVRNNVSSSYLLHDADGLGPVLRRRVQQDPVVERLQHRFHRLHAAHQTYKLCCDVTNCSDYRRNPGRGAGGAARPPALIRYASTGGIHLLADSWQKETGRDMKTHHFHSN